MLRDYECEVGFVYFFFNYGMGFFFKDDFERINVYFL